VSLPLDREGGTYGAKAVQPRLVEKALGILGGQLQRQAKGYPYLLYKMPTDQTIMALAAKVS